MIHVCYAIDNVIDIPSEAPYGHNTSFDEMGTFSNNLQFIRLAWITLTISVKSKHISSENQDNCTDLILYWTQGNLEDITVYRNGTEQASSTDIISWNDYITNYARIYLPLKNDGDNVTVSLKARKDNPWIFRIVARYHDGTMNIRNVPVPKRECNCNETTTGDRSRRDAEPCISKETTTLEPSISKETTTLGTTAIYKSTSQTLSNPEGHGNTIFYVVIPVLVIVIVIGIVVIFYVRRKRKRNAKTKKGKPGMKDEEENEAFPL